MDSEYSFPLDIEREIFETTAILHRRTIPALLRVCHRVHSWKVWLHSIKVLVNLHNRVEPLLYAALQISSADDPLLSALRSKPLTFRQHAVRHLFLHHRLNGSTKEVNEEVLCACPGIINLVIDRGLDLDLLPVLDKLRLQRIDLSVPPLGSQWASSILKHRLFLSITHLSFFQNHDADPEPSKWEDWSQLAALPALTHLSLSEDISAIFPSALDECRGLVLAVTLFWTRPLRTRAVTFAQRLAVADARFLVMVTANAVETEWEIGAWGGDDYWARAERFIARRRAGEIEATCYFLDETADQMSQLLRVSRISI
ncbi:hypothetical protein C8R46DRAFT_1227831 [Mycena filopes]|nr:hypothetical protein C8R46DRAFT_1227831 [Mycena filopes]